MGRSVRITISRKIGEIIKLAKGVFSEHSSLGKNSPLVNIAGVDDLPTQAEEAEKFLNNARKLHAEAEGETEKAKFIMGLGKGQSMNNPKGTILHTLGKSRNQLKITHEGEEEQISKYGYNVVVS